MQEQPRKRDGRYAQVEACDACGKNAGYPNHNTDDEVCGNGDGPGFFLCNRKTCGKRYENLGVEDRRTLFAAQRAKNDAAAALRQKVA
jgi:hypothetical protein